MEVEAILDPIDRLKILQSRTNKVAVFAPDVNLEVLAARTKNFSRAELESLVNSAILFALHRHNNLPYVIGQADLESLKVTMKDFIRAREQIIPALGVSTDCLERCRPNGMVKCGGGHEKTYEGLMLLAGQLKLSNKRPLVTCLLEGPSGSGKTALAATVGIRSDFPFVKIVSAETLLGLDQSTKCEQIVKVFKDAYKSPLSIIILDDIERLVEYIPIGPHFSQSIYRTLLDLLKQQPPEGKKVMVIGTRSVVCSRDSRDSLGSIYNAFSDIYHVPKLKTEAAKKVLEELNVFSVDDIDAAAAALNNMPIKKLYMSIEMAGVEQGGGVEALDQRKIDITHFKDCLYIWRNPHIEQVHDSCK